MVYPAELEVPMTMDAPAVVVVAMAWLWPLWAAVVRYAPVDWNSLDRFPSR